MVVGFSTFQTECANSKYKFKFTYNRCKYKFKFKYDRQTYNFQPDNSKFKSVDSLQPFPFIYIYIYHNWNQEFMHHFGNLTDSVVVHSHRFIYVYIFGRCYALLSIFGGAMNQLIIKGLWHRVQRRPPCRRFDNVPRERNIVLPLHTTVCHSSFPLYRNSRWSYRGQIIPGG